MKLRQLGISYNAAWRMRHKRQVMMERDRAHPSGFIQLDDAYLGGERKRGRGAPGKTPFVAAVEPTPRATRCAEAHRGRGLPTHRNRRLAST